MLRAADRATIRAALDDVLDQALVFHAFTDYMRDYEAVTYSVADPRTGIQPAFDRYLFRHCVRASVTSTLGAGTWRASTDDRLTDHKGAVDLDGFVWGVRWQVLYPGATVLAGSPEADTWASAVGLQFHEVVIETNAQRIALVFHDLLVTRLEPGWTPFVARHD